MDDALRHRLLYYLEVAVIVAAFATVPVTLLYFRSGGNQRLLLASWLIWLIFFCELVVQLWLEPPTRANRRKHLFNLAIVVLTLPALPAVLEVLRLARLARLAPLLRLTGSLWRGADAFRIIFRRRGMVLVATLATGSILVGAAVMHQFEPETVRGGYGSAIWWAIVTLTTVGYGDIAPATTAGRITAGILMLAGIGLISTLAAAIAAYFVGQDESPELKRIEERLLRIERHLEAVARDRVGAPSNPDDATGVALSAPLADGPETLDSEHTS